MLVEYQQLTSLPTSSLNSDGHRALQGLGASIDETIRISPAGEAKEECGSHVDKDDAPKDLSNSLRDSNSRVPRLSGSNRN